MKVADLFPSRVVAPRLQAPACALVAPSDWEKSRAPMILNLRDTTLARTAPAPKPCRFALDFPVGGAMFSSSSAAETPPQATTVRNTRSRRMSTSLMRPNRAFRAIGQRFVFMKLLFQFIACMKHTFHASIAFKVRIHDDAGRRSGQRSVNQLGHWGGRSELEIKFPFSGSVQAMASRCVQAVSTLSGSKGGSHEKCA